METITKHDYLRRCAKIRTPIENRDWYIKAIGIPKLVNEDYSKLGPLDLCTQIDGLYAVKEDLSGIMKIVDYKRDEALFRCTDPIIITEDVMSNVTKNDYDTTVGRLLVNAVVVPPDLESKLPYMNKKMSVGDWEKIFASKIKNEDEERSPTDITVEEFIRLENNITFFGVVGILVNTAATAKTIRPAPGLKEKKAELLKKYEGQLHDPVKLVELEEELRAYDKEYLKDDPAANNTFVGKTMVGRFKMYGLQGNGLDFVKDRNNDTLIETAISDGLNVSESEVPKYFNDSRYASFSRGSNTALGGYTYKTLQRSLNTLSISPTPCNTSKGLVTVINKGNAAFSVGRYLKENNKWILLKDAGMVNSYLGKTVEIRSPMYCKAPGDTVCFACMSLRYKNLPNGVTNIASGVSSTLLTMFLKLMHGIKTTVTDIEKSDLIN